MIKRTSIIALAVSGALVVGTALLEGYTDKAVIPIPGDRPTKGFGNANGVKLGDTTTPTRALVDLLNELNATSNALKKCIDAPLTQYEFDAYGSLAYNVGAGAVCKSSIPAKLAAGRYAEACATIKDFDKFRDCSKPKVWSAKHNKMVCPLVPIRGLTIRRDAEYKTCMGLPNG